MKLKLFVPLTKVDAVQRIVYGTATREEVDKSEEIFDYESSKPLFQKWSDDIHAASGGKSYGNIRAMHGKVAAGKLDQPITFNDENMAMEVAAKIVDDNEWKKVEEGVYTGFSIGGKYAKIWKDEKLGKNRFTADPSEISIVDNPCVASATFSLIKADGVEEQIEFQHHGLPPVPEAEKSAAPSNEAVAARAGVLAKAAGNETAWASYIEQASTELTKIVPTPDGAQDGKTAATAAASPQPIAVAEPTNDEVALEATKLAKAAGNESKWPDYIAPARDALVKAKADAKAKDDKAKGADDEEGDDAKAKDAKDKAKAKDGDKTGKAAFVASPRNPEPGLEQVWQAKDGSVHETIKAARAHNEALEKAASSPDAAKALAAALGKADVALGLKQGEGTAPPAPVAEAVVVAPADALKALLAGLGKVALLPKLRTALIKQAGTHKLDLPDVLNVEKAEAYQDGLKKSLYDVGRLADLVQSLFYYAQSVAYEEEYENDTTSTTAAQCKQLAAQLAQVLRQRVVEETNELFTGETDPIIIDLFELAHRPRGIDAIEKIMMEDGGKLEKSAVVSCLNMLGKVGAKHSMKDQATLNKAHDATAELGADCSGGADTEKLTKAGARHSKADLAKIQQAHDNLVDVGAECADGDMEDTTKLAKDAVTGGVLDKDAAAKLAKLENDNAALTKVATEALTKVEALVKRVEELAAQPVPGGPAATQTYRVIGKGEDSEEAQAANEVLDEIRKSNPDALATALIKMSQKGGGTKFLPGERI